MLRPRYDNRDIHALHQAYLATDPSVLGVSQSCFFRRIISRNFPQRKCSLESGRQIPISREIIGILGLGKTKEILRQNLIFRNVYIIYNLTIFVSTYQSDIHSQNIWLIFCGSNIWNCCLLPNGGLSKLHSYR